MRWSGHYCMHLDELGRPCNRKVMKLGMCEEHREDPEPKQETAEERQTRLAAQSVANGRYRAKTRRERASIGVAAAMECA
jgi:hypothetical protein